MGEGYVVCMGNEEDMVLGMGLADKVVDSMGSKEKVVGIVAGWVLCGEEGRKAVNFVVRSTVVAWLGLCIVRRLVWMLGEGGGEW